MKFKELELTKIYSGYEYVVEFQFMGLHNGYLIYLCCIKTNISSYTWSICVMKNNKKITSLEIGSYDKYEKYYEFKYNNFINNDIYFYIISLTGTEPRKFVKFDTIKKCLTCINIEENWISHYLIAYSFTNRCNKYLIINNKSDNNSVIIDTINMKKYNSNDICKINNNTCIQDCNHITKYYNKYKYDNINTIIFDSCYLNYKDNVWSLIELNTNKTLFKIEYKSSNNKIVDDYLYKNEELYIAIGSETHMMIYRIGKKIIDNPCLSCGKDNISNKKQIIIPCGHYKLCDKCFDIIKDICPICNMKIQKIINIE